MFAGHPRLRLVGVLVASIVAVVVVFLILLGTILLGGWAGDHFFD